MFEITCRAPRSKTYSRRYVVGTIGTLVAALFLAPVEGLSAGTAQEKQERPDFPTREEIQLVVNQAERAFQMYKSSVDLEATVPQQEEALKRDRELIRLSGTLIAALKRDPTKFHGTGGLLLLSGLDDASRNAALCTGGVVMQIAEQIGTKGDLTTAHKALLVAQNCQAVSQALYTVSESVHALLIKEMTAQGNLAEEAMKALETCSALLEKAKQRTPRP